MKISVSLALTMGDNFPVVVLDNAKYAQLEATDMYAVYNEQGQKVFEAPRQNVLYVTYLQDDPKPGSLTGVTADMIAESQRENSPTILPAMPEGTSFAPPPPVVPQDSLVKPDTIDYEKAVETLDNGPLA